MYLKGSDELQDNKFLNVLMRVVRLDEVRDRRPGRSFTDLSRYVVDTKFVLSNLRSKCKVLDIGTGAGIFSVVLAQMGYDVTASDISVEIERNVNFFKKFGCKFVSANLGERALPFKNGEFEAILCLHVLEHLRKPRESLSELRRVLGHGGILIIMTPNGLATWFYNRLWPIRLGNSDHIREYTVSELVNMLKAADFEVYNVGYSNEMVSAGLVNSHTLRKLLGRFYISLCRLFPKISYEIHLAAWAGSSVVKSTGLSLDGC